MNRLFQRLALLCCIPCAAEAQQLVDFEAALPDKWTVSIAGAQTTTDFHRSGTTAFRLTQIGFLTSAPIQNAGLVQYWLRPPGAGDDLTIVVETSSDGISWIEKQRIDHVFSPTNPNALTGAFEPRTFGINVLGGTQVRWRVARYAAGSAYVDDVQISLMSDAEVFQAKQKELEEKTRKVLEEVASQQVNVATYADAQKRFSEATTLVNDNLIRLVNILEKTRTIKLIADVASATATRNQMANPAQYSSFKTIIQNVQPLLPAVQNSRLTDLLSMIQNPAGIALTVGRGVLAMFSNSFKDVVASGLTDYSLRSVYKNDNQIPALARTAEDRVKTYGNIRNFLQTVETEGKVVDGLNERLDATSVEAEFLERDILATLPNYLAAAGGSTSEASLGRLILKEKAARDSQVTKIAGYFTRTLGTNAEFKGSTLSDQQRAVLREVERQLVSVDLLSERYQHLASQLIGYADAFLASLKTNPFENQVNMGLSAQEWQENKDKAEKKMTSARKSMEMLYKTDPSTQW